MKKPSFLCFVLFISAFCFAQVHEKIDRGVVALARSTESVYVGWSLFKTDPENIEFNIYRQDIGFGDFVKVNTTPVSNSTNFLDSTILPGHGYNYKVKSVIAGKETDEPGTGYVFTLTGSVPWYSIKLKDNVELKRIGFGDLDGDGAYDFVMQSPDFNVDPYYRPGYWKRSPEPYKLNAYTSTGKHLWEYDMGWAIETGTCYSAYMVFDIDQDGLAEVYTQAGEGDPRETDGHV